MTKQIKITTVGASNSTVGRTPVPGRAARNRSLLLWTKEDATGANEKIPTLHHRPKATLQERSIEYP